MAKDVNIAVDLDQGTSVDRFERDAMQLIQEATGYAAEGEYDEDTEKNIRKCRVITQVLTVALQQAQLPRPPAD